VLDDPFPTVRAQTLRAITRGFVWAGLLIDECIILGIEWGEFFEAQSGKAGRLLLHAGRLLRDPERYIDRFGQRNYDIKFGDCLWHVYRLVGKLSGRIYVLSPKP
jgi:hypothetical protein